ncbi:MAG: hypothetical protein ACK41D_02980 [Rubricoccaceae bacterium]
MKRSRLLLFFFLLALLLPAVVCAQPVASAPATERPDEALVEAVLDALEADVLRVFLVRSSLKDRSLWAVEQTVWPDTLSAAAAGALRLEGEAALLAEAVRTLDRGRYRRFLARDVAVFGLENLDEAFERYLAAPLPPDDALRLELARRYIEASGRLDFMAAVARPGVAGVASTPDAQFAIAMQGLSDEQAVEYAMEAVRLQMAEVLPVLYAHLHRDEPVGEIEAMVAWYESAAGAHAAALVTGAFAAAVLAEAGTLLRQVGVESVTGPPYTTPPQPGGLLSEDRWLEPTLPPGGLAAPAP